MKEVLVKQITDKKEWERFLSKHSEANFLQSWSWGEFHERLGQRVVRSGFYRDEKLVGVLLGVVEDAKRGKYMTVAGGPILDWSDEELVAAAFAEMRRAGKEAGCVFVRIRPQIQMQDLRLMTEDEKVIALFRRHGCRNAPMYLSAELTSQLDITPSEDELLKGMRKTTRYEVKKAMSLGVKISTSTDEALIRDFYNLQLETAKRQKFVPFSYAFFLEQFKMFFAEGTALLYTATYEKVVLAQAFIIFYGSEAVYHYGASTEDGRKYPGAYLIQWEAIKEAKRRGMTRYNFFGVAPEGETNHRFSGISVFKRGFGGQDVEYLHAQDLVLDRAKYLLTLAVEKLRKIRRRV
jgi:lipid II:glycine glycyltransferase (peptidoglycan interpeptide bridge formation enzyme)